MQNLFVGVSGWDGGMERRCWKHTLPQRRPPKTRNQRVIFSIQSLYLKIIILIIFRARQGGTPEWPSDHIFLEGVFDMLPASEEGTPAVPDGRQDQALDAPGPFHIKGR